MLEAILELLIPTLMVYIIDVGISGGDTGYILRMGILMLGIAAIGLCSALVCQYSASVASQGYGTALRDRLFHHIASLSHKELDRLGTPSLINRITNDANVLQQAVAMLIRLVIRAPFISVGSMVMAMILDFKLAIIIIVAFPLFVLAIYLIMKATIPLYKKVQKRLDRLAVIIRENLSGVRVIRAFSAEKTEEKRFREENEDFAKAYIRVGKISSLLNPATSVIMNLAVIAILRFGGIRVNGGSLTQGEIIAFTNYISYMVTALLVTANLVILFTRAWASAERIAAVLNTENSLTEPENPAEFDRSAPAVEFSHVYFRYNEPADEDPAWVLEDIHFTLERGETLGIIGGTGSGKSSLIRLIPRFYDTNAGTVKIFGHNVKEYPSSLLRKTVGVAAQRAVLFSGTVAENIRMGNPQATDEEMIAAAKAAQASEFIEKMKEGYATEVERGGTNLSGGQKQRLSIARSLLAKPEILILDDCSGALDYATEAALRREIRKYGKDMTVIIVAQRPSSIKYADKILVLEDGKCIGAGTHETLYAECGVYKEICDSQE